MRLSLTAGLLLFSVYARAATLTGYIGTAPRSGAQGNQAIYSFRWDGKTGTPSAIRTAAGAAGPSFLVLSKNARFLYAVNEGGAADAGRVSAFARPDTAALEPLRDLGSVSSMGSGPCHVSVDHTGHWLFVANYRDGRIAVIPIHADGRLGDAVQTIAPAGRAHAHEMVQSPDGRFLLSVDLGLDAIFSFRFRSSSGTLTANDPPAQILPSGYGPRHLLFSQNARFVYALTELSAKLITFRWDERRGSLQPIAEISALPTGDTSKPSAAEIALSKDGRFIYTSHRGDSNSIAIFHIGADGIPYAAGSIASGGKTPRYIGIDPTGDFLLAANQQSGDIVSFRIDHHSGALTPTGRLEVPAPTDIVFAPPLKASLATKK